MLGSIPGLCGRAVEGDRGVATVDAVLQSPIRFLDTADGDGADGESVLWNELAAPLPSPSSRLDASA